MPNLGDALLAGVSGLVGGTASQGATIMANDRDVQNKEDMAKMQSDIDIQRDQTRILFTNKAAMEQSNAQFQRNANFGKAMNDAVPGILQQTYDDPENASPQQTLQAKIDYAESQGRFDYADSLRKQMSSNAQEDRASAMFARSDAAMVAALAKGNGKDGNGGNDPAEVKIANALVEHKGDQDWLDAFDRAHSTKDKTGEKFYPDGTGGGVLHDMGSGALTAFTAKKGGIVKSVIRPPDDGGAATPTPTSIVDYRDYLPKSK